MVSLGCYNSHIHTAKMNPSLNPVKVSQALNSIKQTYQNFCQKHSLDHSEFVSFIQGDSLPSASLIKVLKEHPIIDYAALSISYDDGLSISVAEPYVAFFSAASSYDSRRVTYRDGIKYYEYRDLATSKFSPILPEYIIPCGLSLECTTNGFLRQPFYNNGHIENQVTAFFGNIDFHWIDAKKSKYTQSISHLATNYISPYVPHSFTSLDSESFIVAITYRNTLSYVPSEALLQEILSAQTHNPSSLITSFQSSIEFGSCNASFQSRPRSPSVRIFTTSDTKYDLSIDPRVHSFIFIYYGSALVSNSFETYSLSVRDSLSLYSYDFTLCIDPQSSVILFTVDEPADLYSLIHVHYSEILQIHGAPACGRIFNDNRSWF